MWPYEIGCHSCEISASIGMYLLHLHNWGFPKIGVPLIIIHSRRGLSLIDHPFGGTPIYGNLQYCTSCCCLYPNIHEFSAASPLAPCPAESWLPPVSAWAKQWKGLTKDCRNITTPVPPHVQYVYVFNISLIYVYPL